MFAGNRCGTGRSAQKEMRQLRESRSVEPDIDLDEYWPFPRTINEVDPYLYELEKQLIGLQTEK